MASSINEHGAQELELGDLIHLEHLADSNLGSMLVQVSAANSSEGLPPVSQANPPSNGPMDVSDAFCIFFEKKLMLLKRYQIDISTISHSSYRQC